MARAAFQKCKDTLAKATMLTHPIPSAPLALMVDASDSSIGAVLQQRVNSTWQPLSFFSQKLSPAQHKYSAYDRELLAAYTAVKHFRHLLEGTEFTIYTDHKPLTFAFQQRSDKASPRQIRHLEFIAQFSNNIQHIKGKDNPVADAMSRISSITIPASVDFSEMASSQASDEELQSLLSDSAQTSLVLKLFPVNNTETQLYCDVSTSVIRPYVPKNFRQTVFESLHNLAHPSIRSTIKSVSQRFVWPAMTKDITKMARSCLACQRSKVSRHTSTAPGNFPPVSSRFDHVHLDIVGPLPPSHGYSYCLTMIDRFTRWPEVVPIADIHADTIAQAFYTGWIARFGTPLQITTDQGRQFESSLFRSLSNWLGVTRIRSSPYHPAANGMIERFHRSLKAAIKCHTTHKWVDVLPTVLLGLRTTFKPELQTTTAELVYGSPLRLPGDFFHATSETTDPTSFVAQLKSVIDTLRPVPASHHSKPRIFVHHDLDKCSHVFLRRDALRKPLQPPYDGPYRVLSRNQKTFQLSIKDKSVTVSIDRLKPAYLSAEEVVHSTHPVAESPSAPSSEPLPSSASTDSPPTPAPLYTTRAGRKVRFNVKYT